MHLEHPSKLWNTAELGSLLVKRLRADSKKQQCRHPQNPAVELARASDGHNNAATQPRD
jgi:hypothetical protein